MGTVVSRLAVQRCRRRANNSPTGMSSSHQAALVGDPAAISQPSSSLCGRGGKVEVRVGVSVMVGVGVLVPVGWTPTTTDPLTGLTPTGGPDGESAETFEQVSGYVPSAAVSEMAI